MTNKTTKRALLASIVSLVLCFSMLLGTTYAWFTDSASSVNNVIKSGNLDVVLEVGTLNAGGASANPNDWTWTALDLSQPIIELEDVEPGYVATKAIRIRNNGSLAFKYQLSTAIVSETTVANIEGGTFKLSDYLYTFTSQSLSFTDWDREKILEIIDISLAGNFNDGFGAGTSNTSVNRFGDIVATDLVLKEGESQAFAFAVAMPTWVDNKANHAGVAPQLTFGINVLATQFTYEKDSFDDQYDKEAYYSGALNKDGNVYSLTGDATIADESFFADYNATDAYTVNGNGHTVTGVATYVPGWGSIGNMPENGIVFASSNGAKTTVNDITFTGNSQMIMSGYYNPSTGSTNYNSEFNNVKVVDIKATGSVNNEYFAMSIYGNATMNNCTVKNTTVSALCDDHATAEVYDIAIVNGAKLIANNSTFGSLYTGKHTSSNFWGKAYVELNNSSADVIYACGRTNGGATVINSGSYVTKIVANNNSGINLTIAEGAVVDTLDLTAITGAASKSTFNIQGTVNTIVDGTNVYTTIDEWIAAQ
ncbi:MAG: hypothetical protein IJB43_01635 [Clostridia bacterium]|nr:hypothetical protein [Clostridia bacterium]